MTALLDRLKNGSVLLADGAMGTMLMAHGLKPGEPPERMNLEKTEVVRQVARDYAAAGSDIVLTNSFGGSPIRLAHYQLEDKCDEINRNAVRAARMGAGEKAIVAASVGPCGGMLEPLGSLTPQQIRESFEKQLTALIGEGVDLICIETMTDLNEAIIAVKAARQISPDIPISATMTFDATPRGFFTIMGNSIKDVAEQLEESGANIIGSNCGNGSDTMIEVAREFRKQSRLPILIQANAGLPITSDAGLVYPESPTQMAAAAIDLVTAGVSIVGGCCGTTPDHIAAMRQAVDRLARAL